jgi:hypothetical protein
MTKDSDLYSFCYENNRVIVTDPDQDSSGAPYCDGQCERCNKIWGDEQ